MRLLWSFSTSTFSCGVALILAAGISLLPSSALSQTPPQPIPATEAFEAPPCSDSELGGIDALGLVNIPSPQRTNPEWKAIILDSNQPPHLQPPKVLEGFVRPTPNNETSKDQATAEVAEEDLSWTHYTHDWTFKVLPDPAYQYLLSSWVPFPGETFPNPGIPDYLFSSLCASLGGSVTDNNCLVPPETCPDGITGPLCQHIDMEVEWDSASLMDVGNEEGFARDFGAVPEFVWPAVGDRVWVEGRWIFDCGHPSTPAAAANSKQYVKFSTEIHPPRALVTFRLNHPALDSFPRPRISAPNFPAPQSYLPVTGVPVDSSTLPPGVPDNGPTQVLMTEADVFVSVNGGAANDICTIVPAPCSAFVGHTGAIIPVNDRNYVFDIYPPGTDYLGFERPRENGNFGVSPPVPDASLQWRIVDHFSELPAHACGGTDNTVCVTVDPIICLVDSKTPPPDQTETSCPEVPAQPTRLRVILPFAGTNANFFAKSILLGWDYVPAPASSTLGVRTFQVRLHQFTRIDNGGSNDWRIFVNVGGQWRYLSSVFDTDANNGGGISGLDGGNNVCRMDPVLELLGIGCFHFDNTPWTVSVQDGLPIHVGVGGFVARGVEDPGSSLFLCRNYPGGCNTPDFSIFDEPFRDYPFENDDRIGTYEFDLVGPDYSAPVAFTTQEFGCSIHTFSSCNLRYQVEFRVEEVTPTAPPLMSNLHVGDPQYNGFVSSDTPLILSSTAIDAEGFQYRFRRPGDPLPTYASLPDFPGVPVHWAHADIPTGSQSLALQLQGIDGLYLFQWSAETFGNLLEPRHTQQLTLDNTPPVTAIGKPAATQYTHSDSFTITYSVDDGSGSGVKSDVPNIDGLTTLQDGTPVAPKQIVHLLTALSLGTHTFTVDSVDNVNNAGAKSVTFSVIVTADSIEGDVAQFLNSGAIKNSGQANSLLAKLDAAAAARTRGQCSTASNIYQAFISKLQAQSGQGVDATAAAIMIADAQYLIAHCP
jgi:hypothetical protein